MTYQLTPQSRCRFGIATADITPPVGIYHRMWGAASHDRSEGIHRPLTATALTFGNLDAETDPTSYQVLVALDHCLLGVDEVNLILQHTAKQAGIPAATITITFSHTHAAGLLNLDRAELPGGELIPDYLQQLAETVAELVCTAASNSRPADFVYGTGRCNLAAHRDFFDPESEEYVCGYNPAGEADDTVTVVRVTDDRRDVMAAIVNYACHPTTLAWQNRFISPDYPGALRETVEHVIGAPCVFLQGASGELGPVEGFVGDLEVADRNGRQLAYATLSTWESLPPPDTSFAYSGKVVSGAAIGTWQRMATNAERESAVTRWECDRQHVPLPYRKDLARYEAVESNYLAAIADEQRAENAGDLLGAKRYRALAEREKRMLGRLQGMPAGDTYPFQTTLWKMGDAIWIAVQGEPYSLLQRRLRETFPQTPLVISTIANGWGPSYLPEQQLYDTGIYQASIAALAPGSLETLIANLSARIATWQQTS